MECSIGSHMSLRLKNHVEEGLRTEMSEQYHFEVNATQAHQHNYRSNESL